MESYKHLLGVKESPDMQFPPAGCECGDQFLVGVIVVIVVPHKDCLALHRGVYTPKTRINWHVIEATETGWHDQNGDSWGAWSTDDVTFWVKLPYKPDRFDEQHRIGYTQGDAMTFSEMNKLRCESPNGFNHKLNSWSLSDWMTALAGEVGEAANIIKKLNRYRDGIPGNDLSESDLRYFLADEIADIAIYLDLLAQAAGLDLETVRQAKFEKTSKKIGYTP